MKKILIFFTVFLIGFSANAQFRKKPKEKIRAYKIAFLTERLDLTEKEAEKFWVLYNAYDKQMMELRHREHTEIFKKVKKNKGADLSEEESEKIIALIQSLEQECFQVRTQFFKKIKGVLPYTKQLKLEIAEHDFHRKLMRKLKGKKK